MFKQIMRHGFFFWQIMMHGLVVSSKKNYAWLSGLGTRDILPEMSFRKRKQTHLNIF